MLVSAHDTKVKHFVNAASSCTFGDHPDLPKLKEKIGKSPHFHAVIKVLNELNSEVFARTFGFKAIGLRYFNIFGRRQDPNNSYAAVIPEWIDAMIKNELIYINGDVETN